MYKIIAKFSRDTCLKRVLLHSSSDTQSASGQGGGNFIKIDSLGLRTVPPKRIATCERICKQKRYN